MREIPSLVSPEWLHDKLGNPVVRVIENAWEADAYTRAHIPGAVRTPCHPHLKHFDAQGRKSPHVLRPDEFRALCHELGLRSDRHYVIYDDWHGLFSTRFWWVCRYYGVDNVSVLNGGWHGWLSKNRPVSCRLEQPDPGTDISPQAHPEMLVELDELRTVHRDPVVQVWDTRRASEFNGSEQTDNHRQGHIPGALNRVWTDLLTEPSYDGGGRFLKPRDELECVAEQLGLRRDKT